MVRNARLTAAAAAAAILATAACTTTIREMRLHEPRATYVSAQSERALEACLAAHLSWISPPAIIRGEGTTELSFGADSSAVLVTVRPTAGGTQVTVRQLLTYGRRVRNNVEACVAGAV